MLKNTIILTCSVLTAAAFAGTAPPPQQQVYEPEPLSLISYSNVSLGYLYTSVDFLGNDLDGHGVALGGEFSPIDNLYLALNGSWSDFNGLDYWTGKAGVGVYAPLTDNLHFVTELGASYVSLNDDDSDIDLDNGDWGIYAMPHLRAKFGAIEVHAGVIYDSNPLVIAEWNAFAKLLFEVSPELDIYVSANRGFESEAFDDVWGAQAGVRFKF